MDRLIEIDGDLGEVLCPECKGFGCVHRGVYGIVTCPKCNGRGKLDWCERIVGAVPKTIEHYKMSFTDFAEDFLHDDNQEISAYHRKIIDDIAKAMAVNIDNEILRSIQGDLEQNVNNKTVYGGSVYDHRVIS